MNQYRYPYSSGTTLLFQSMGSVRFFLMLVKVFYANQLFDQKQRKTVILNIIIIIIIIIYSRVKKIGH